MKLPLAELWIGEMVSRQVGGQRVVVLRLEDRVCAYVDRCAHLGVPISEGSLDGTVLTCRAHQYQYDARTGEGVNPRGVRLTPVPVEVEGGVIHLGGEP
jgi:toluene monooxygenase system ferredoxin subunit